MNFISYLQFNCAEENQKRLENGYGQVAFNYDQTSTSQNDMNEESTKAENSNRDDCPDEPYVPHPRFYIPPGVELVRLLKHVFLLFIIICQLIYFVIIYLLIAKNNKSTGNH